MVSEVCSGDDERPPRKSPSKAKKPKKVTVTTLPDALEVTPMHRTEEQWRAVNSKIGAVSLLELKI